MNINFYVLMAECLVRHRVVAAPFTADEYEQSLIEAIDRHNSGEEDFDIEDALPLIVDDKDEARAKIKACNQAPLE